MRLKSAVKLLEKALGAFENSDAPRADMYLPVRLLAMCILALAVGVGAVVYGLLFQFSIGVIAVAAIGFGLGVAAWLCWKNQSIHVISATQFTYTTMFGKTTTYEFSAIEGLRKNQDSLTLFVAGDKVHIESMAVLSERLVSLLNQALQQN